MGLLQMARMGLLAIFVRAQDLQDCGVETSPFTVTSTEDAATLASSLDCSNGDFVVQWVGEIFVVETIRVTNATTLNITGAGSGAIADGQNVTQLFVVDQGSRLHFSDMTFAHGNASSFGGAISAFEASVSFYGNVSFTSNSAGEHGGAIYAYNSTVSWGGDGTQFISNSAGERGGAISVEEESTVSWDGDGAYFISNSAIEYHGGAIFVDEKSTLSWDGDGTQFISNSAGEHGGAISVDSSTVSWDGNDTKFISNSAGERGGAIYVYDNSDVSWDGNDTQFISNSAENAGAIYVHYYSTVSFGGDGTRFISNSAGEHGGAIFMGDYSTVFWGGDGTQFNFNSAAGYDGGAIFVDDYAGLSWRGDDTLFSFNSANSANGSGGAIIVAENSDAFWHGNDTQFLSNSANSGGAISVDDSYVFWDGYGTRFNSNTADNGGAIFVEDDAYLNWGGDGTVFSFNYANNSGGAIYVGNAAIVDWDSNDTLFSSNSANNSGGAIFVTGASLLWDGSTTFSKNVAGEYGGAIASVECYSRLSQFYGGTFIENIARYRGGALYASSSVFNFTQVIFISNSASGGGGAVAVDTTIGENPAAGANLATASFAASFTRCNFSDNMSETGGAVESLAGQLEFSSCIFEGNSADEGGALRLLGPTTVVSKCSFVSNSASFLGLAVSAVGSANMSATSFEGNELICPAGLYRQDTQTEGSTTRYDMVCFDCPDWDECPDCSITRGNVLPTCEAPLDHTEAKTRGVTLETLSISAGYWRATTDTDNILACYNADACIGGQTGADGYCAPGYTGPYCAACENGYSPSLYHTCTRCSSSRRQGLMAAIVITALVVAFVVVMIVRYLVSTQLEERNVGCFRRRILRAVPLQALKIVVVVWQILIQFAEAANTTYPGVYNDFLRAVDFVNFDFGSVLSAGCLWSDMDFHDRLLVNTVGPLVVVGPLAMTYRIAMHRSSSVGGDAVVAQVRHRHQTVLLLITFLIYSSVSSTVFQTFACETLDDDIQYLRADYNIQCTDAKHKAFEIYAAIMIAVYPIGIPLLYATLLFQRRDVLADVGGDKTKAQSIASLWEPYRPERFYYEVIECGRRVMLTGVVVFIFPGDAAQIAITMLFAFLFFMVFEMLQPYEAESDLWMSRGGHVTVFLSMFDLLLRKVDVSGERDQSQALYGGVLVTCHVLLVVAIVVEVFGICYTSKRKNVAEQTVPSPESHPNLRAPAGSDDDVPAFETVPPAWRSFMGQTSVSAKSGPTRH